LEIYCLPEIHKILSDFRNWEGKFPIVVDDASCHLSWPQRMRLSDTAAEIWRPKDNRVTTLTFCGYVTSSVTWPLDSRGSTSYGLSTVTMCLSSTVMEIWQFEVLPGRLFQKQRSVVGRRSSVVSRSILNITLIS